MRPSGGPKSVLRLSDTFAHSQELPTLEEAVLPELFDQIAFQSVTVRVCVVVDVRRDGVSLEEGSAGAACHEVPHAVFHSPGHLTPGSNAVSLSRSRGPIFRLLLEALGFLEMRLQLRKEFLDEVLHLFIFGKHFQPRNLSRDAMSRVGVLLLRGESRQHQGVRHVQIMHGLSLVGVRGMHVSMVLDEIVSQPKQSTGPLALDA